jgi:hypothetical protein
MANLLILLTFGIVLIIVHTAINQFLVMKELIQVLIIEIKDLKSRREGFVSFQQPRPSEYPSKLETNLLKKTAALEVPVNLEMEAELATYINELPTQHTTPLSFSDESKFGSPWNIAPQFERPL